MPLFRTRLALTALSAFSVTAICLVSSAGGAAAAQPRGGAKGASLPTITIGSENFTEELVLGNLYNDALEHAGFKTKLRSDLGARAYVDEAMAHKAIDLFPDYAGSLLAYLVPGETSLATRLSTDLPALRKALARQGATVLNPAPAIDTNVFVVTAATAKKYHLKTISDLQPVASKMVFAGPPECPQYAYCLKGLESLYHLHFKGFLSADESGPITLADLKNKFFSTDTSILGSGFVRLADNKHLEPADHVIPVIRKSFDTKAVAKALNAVSAKLTTPALAGLDKEATDNHDPAADAAQWLKKVGLT
ncbi:MAG: ABC transporter substrate-binding protein [Actinobacteria bacterium]|nr:ABC transporter substrate-binding protein [Actinomycetota bacterium]